MKCNYYQKIIVCLCMMILVFNVFILFATPVFAVVPSSDGGTSTGITDSDKGFFGGMIESLLDGLKKLFVPSDKFFVAFKDKISKAIDSKTGGLITSITSITDRFHYISLNGGQSNSLILSLPKNHLYNGYSGVSVDILKYGDKGFKYIRDFFTTALVIFTVIICYRKLVVLFRR